MKQFNFFKVSVGSSISSKSKDANKELTWTASKIEIVFLFKTANTCLPYATVFLFSVSSLTIYVTYPYLS